MKSKYYLILQKMPSELDRELCEGGIVQDVGSNMFYAHTISGAIQNQYQQLSGFSRDMVKSFMEYHKVEYIKLV